MTHGHGGARPGAGRKRKAEKYETQINAAEQLAADRLTQNIENLAALADGGYERVIERFEPAATVLIDLPLRDATGEVLRDANGRPIIAKQPAFPDADPDTLVLVEKRREYADKDRAANIWLTEFIAGKVTQAVELTGEDGGPIQLARATDLTDDELAAIALHSRAGAAASPDSPDAAPGLHDVHEPGL